MSDTYTILFYPKALYYKYALVKPDGTVCNWSNSLSNLCTTKGDSYMQSPTYHSYNGYHKLTLPNSAITDQHIRHLYPEFFI